MSCLLSFYFATSNSFKASNSVLAFQDSDRLAADMIRTKSKLFSLVPCRNRSRSESCQTGLVEFFPLCLPVVSLSIFRCISREDRPELNSFEDPCHLFRYFNIAFVSLLNFNWPAREFRRWSQSQVQSELLTFSYLHHQLHFKKKYDGRSSRVEEYVCCGGEEKLVDYVWLICTWNWQSSLIRMEIDACPTGWRAI